MRIICLGLLCAVAAAAGAQPAQSVWQMQESGTTAGLRGIDSVDGTVAWATGTGGTVLRTVDGGEHWTKCAVPDGDKDGGTLDFRGVQAWDAKTAIVMASGPGEKSRLYKTVDGCGTWKLILKNPDSPKGFFDSFWMYPQYNVGIVLGDPVHHHFVVLETRDGGARWVKDRNSGLNIRGDSASGFAASNGLLAQTRTGYMYGFVAGGNKQSFYFHRNSSFDRWIAGLLPLPRSSESSGPFAFGMRWTRPTCMDCIHPVDYFFVVVGGDYALPNNVQNISAYSLDVGEHWAVSTKTPHGYRSTVQWSESLKVWITAGTNGSDISRDDGRTWTPLDDGNWNALSSPFVVGPGGRIGRLKEGALPKP